ncbi:MAG: OmpA family protein [Candidatus Omnitrophota bacterium]
MKIRKIILSLFLVVSSCLLLSEASAQKGAYVADFICEYAKNLYDQGILEEAKHEFSKALIIDPDNTMAKSYLEKMGLETGKYAVERPDLAVSALTVSKPAYSVSNAPYGAVVFSSQDVNKSDELVVLSAQLAGLKQQIYALQEAMAAKEGDMKSKEEEAGFLKEKFALAQGRLDQLREDALQRDQQLEKLKGQIGALESSSAKQLEMYKAKLETLEASVSVVSKQSQQEDVLLKQAVAQGFSDELIGLRAQLDKLQKEADGKDGALERMKDMLRALEMASAKQIKKYQDALEKLESSVTAKTGEVGVKQDSMEVLAQELVASENQLKDLQGQLALKNSQLEEAKEKIISGVELSEKLSHQHKEELDVLRSSLAGARKELFIKEASLGELEKKLALMQEERDALKKDIIFHNEKTRLSKDSFASQENAIKKQEKSFQELSVLSDRLRREVDALSRSVQEKEDYIKKLAGEYDLYKKRLDEEIHAYRNEIKALEASMGEKDKIIRQKEESIVDLNNKLRIAQDALEASRVQRQEAIRQKEDIEKKHDEEVAYIQEQLKNLREEVSAKDSAIKQLNEKMEGHVFSSDEELKGYKEEINNLQTSVNSKDEALKELRDKLTHVQQDFDGLRGQIQTKEERLSILQKEAQALKIEASRQSKEHEDEAKTLHASIAIKEQELIQKEGLVVQLNEKLTSARGELNELQKAASQRAVQVQQLKEEIVALKDILGRHFQTYNDQITSLQTSFSAQDDLKSAKEQMRDLAIASGRQLKGYHDKMKKLQSLLEVANSELTLSKQGIAEKEGEIANLKNALSAAHLSMSDLGAQVLEKDKMITHLEGRLKNFMGFSGHRFKLEQARVKELEAQLDQQKRTLEEELNLYKGRLSILESFKEEQDKILTQKQGAVEDLLVAKGQMEAMVHLKDEALEAEKINFSNQVKSYKEQLSVAEKSLALKDQLIQEKESVLKDLSDKLVLAMQNVKEKDAEMARQESQIEEIQKKQQDQSESSQEALKKYQDQIKLLKESLAVVKNDLGKAQEDVRQKQGLVDEERKSNSLMQEKIDRMQKEIVDKDGRLDDLEASKVSFERQMDEYRQEMKVLESAFAVKKEDFYKQELMTKELGEQFALAKDRLEKSLAEKEGALKDSLLKLRQVSEEAASLRKDLSKKEGESKSLVSKNEAVRKAQEKKLVQFEENMKSLENALDLNRKQLKEARDLLGDKEAVAQKLEEQVVVLGDKSKQYQDDVISRQEEIKTLKTELKNAQEQAARYEDQFETLEGLLSDKNFQLQTVKTKVDGQAATFGQQLKSYKDKIASLEAALSAKAEDLQNVSGIVEAKSTAFDAINEDLSSAKAQLDHYRAQVTVKDETIDKLENDLRNSELSLKQYTQKISHLEDLIAAKNEELQGKQGLVEEKNSDFSNLANKLIDREKEIVELKCALDNKIQKENELILLKQQLEVLNKNSAAAEVDVKAYQERIRDLEKSLQKKGLDVEKTKNSQQENEKLIKDLYLKIDSLESELKTYKTSAAEKDAQFKVLKEEIRDLADMSDRERKNYEDKIGSLKTSSVAKEKLAQLSNEIKTLASSSGRQLEMYKEQLSVLESSLVSKDEQVREKEERLGRQMAMLSQKEDELKELAKKFGQIQASFEQLKKESATKDGLIDGYKERIKDLAAAAGRQLKGHKDLLNRLSGKNEELETLVEEKDEMMKARVSELNSTMSQLRQSLKSEIKDYQAKLELAKKGIVVGVLADLMFGSGSADISPEGRIVLSKISDVLKKVPGNNHIVVEGHTDNVPIRYSRWRSNWELSAERALSVLEYLVQESGLDPARFSAQGYGEYRPVAENDTDAGKRQNRRVEIVIQPQLRKVDAQELPVFSGSEN